jgi:hypothetical protein
VVDPAQKADRRVKLSGGRDTAYSVRIASRWLQAQRLARVAVGGHPSRIAAPAASPRSNCLFLEDFTTLLIKPGVRITGIRPELLIAVIAAERVFDHAGHDLMLTACIDGKHMAGSLHYSGLAVDIRTKNVPVTGVPELIARIKACVGGDFDVILEADHIHVEFQPKNAITA